LRRAKELLTRATSAAEAAVAVGLFDQSHLINQFRLYFGVTPGAFIAASGQTMVKGPFATVFRPAKDAQDAHVSPKTCLELNTPRRNASQRSYGSPP
jgi:hypothetical protein